MAEIRKFQYGQPVEQSSSTYITPVIDKGYSIFKGLRALDRINDNFKAPLLYSNSNIEPITGEAGNLGSITVYNRKKPKYKYNGVSSSGTSFTFTGNIFAKPLLKGLGYIGEGANKLLSSLATSNSTPSGLYNTPTVQQIQQNQNVRQNVENTLNEKIWPVLTPTNYLTALISEGSLNPYKGAQIKYTWSPIMQLGSAMIDLSAGKGIGKGIKTSINTTKRILDSRKLIQEGKNNAIDYLNSDLYRNNFPKEYPQDIINSYIKKQIEGINNSVYIPFPNKFSSSIGSTIIIPKRIPFIGDKNIILFNTIKSTYPFLKEAGTHEYFHAGSRGLRNLTPIEQGHYTEIGNKLYNKFNNSSFLNYITDPEELRTFHLTSQVYGPNSKHYNILLSTFGEDNINSLSNFNNTSGIYSNNPKNMYEMRNY